MYVRGHAGLIFEGSFVDVTQDERVNPANEDSTKVDRYSYTSRQHILPRL